MKNKWVIGILAGLAAIFIANNVKAVGDIVKKTEPTPQ